MSCQHKHTKIGQNAPRRWGSDKTEICRSCGMFRLLTHHLEIRSGWKPAAEYADAIAEQDLD